MQVARGISHKTDFANEGSAWGWVRGGGIAVPKDASPGTELVYLCTFPAHLHLGMKGVLVVK